MPLRDHFRSPVNDRHSWDEVHGGWPMMLVLHLIEVLPPGYRAAPKVHLGSPSEVDVATYDQKFTAGGDVTSGGAGTATLAAVTSTLTVEADLTEQDEYEVRVYDTEFGRTLVATVEVVCPTNKDRPASRAMFVTRVAALLQQGVCVTLVDLVSIRHENLYAELLSLFDLTDPQLSPTTPPMYAVTLRGRKPPKGSGFLDAWFYPMAVGQPLPTVPIWLTPELHIMLPLEMSYAETCRVLGIAPAESA